MRYILGGSDEDVSRGDDGMAKVYREYEPNQDFLLPPSLKDWLGEGHPAYFISEVVDRMDLSEIFAHYEKEERGQPPYHPRMMTKVLLYGYCMGVRSSRKIAKHLEENVAFRVLAANNQPDFRTISDFRKIHLEGLKKLFVQVLRLCQKAGLVKLGYVALDGTKVKANASKHKAMSYGRMCQAEKELEEEVKNLLAEAQRIDEEEDKLYGADRRGDELPKELARRETRLKKIEEAKVVLEAEARRKAKECHSEAEQTEESPPPPKKKRRPPPTERGKPEAKAQYNFTDPESRIMKNSDKAYLQAYNALAAVDGANQIIVGCEVSDNPADSVSTVEMVKQVEQNCGKKPKRVLADAGHFSEHNVATLEEQGIDVYISPAKQRHTQKTQPGPRGRIPLGLSVKDKMRRKLKTKKGKKTYAKRKWIVEPPFGQIKEARGIRQFLLRGKRKVSGEWSLIATTHNLLKLYLSGRYPALKLEAAA
jgi:transposase